MSDVVYTSETQMEYPPEDLAEKPTFEEMSLFGRHSGYYAAMLDGHEICRFAPSPWWSEYAKWAKSMYGESFSYIYIEERILR